MVPKLESALLISLLLVPLLLCNAQSANSAQSRRHNPFEGAAIYRHYCASCHGSDGRGRGPASFALKHEAPDLTRISQRNGGTFPAAKIKAIIAGQAPGPPAQESREMPSWGPIFHEIGSDQDFGEVMLEAVTRHLQWIQQK